MDGYESETTKEITNIMVSNSSEKLGTKVKINNKKILISFTNNNDLNRILEILDVNE